MLTENSPHDLSAFTGVTLLRMTGRSEIRQGSAADGREYIECADNGVGMGKDVLLSTFANAGERFVYRPTFRAEYARWQELVPPLQMVPNSQPARAGPWPDNEVGNGR